MNGIEGKVALVTGAGNGIGRATAEELARLGATVMAADVDEEGLQRTVKMIQGDGGDARYVVADVTRDEDAKRMVEETLDAFGALDIAVNNAGIEGELKPVHEYAEEAWDKVLDVNLKGVFLGLKHELQAMRANGGGAIVNTASILGQVGFANAGAYTASKHGVLGLTKVAALENAEDGIRVNAVCPGFIETPMVMDRGVKAGEDPDVYEDIAELHPMKRLGKPEEIARTVAWLASDDASFVTGQSLTPDGGYVAQ